MFIQVLLEKSLNNQHIHLKRNRKNVKCPACGVLLWLGCWSKSLDLSFFCLCDHTLSTLRNTDMANPPPISDNKVTVMTGSEVHTISSQSVCKTPVIPAAHTPSWAYCTCQITSAHLSPSFGGSLSPSFRRCMHVCVFIYFLDLRS